MTASKSLKKIIFVPAFFLLLLLTPYWTNFNEESKTKDMIPVSAADKVLKRELRDQIARIR